MAASDQDTVSADEANAEATVGTNLEQQGDDAKTDDSPKPATAGETAEVGNEPQAEEANMEEEESTKMTKDPEPKRITANTKTEVAENMYNLQMICTGTAGRHEFQFPENASVIDVKQRVFDEWPKAFGDIVENVDWIGVLHHGRFWKSDLSLEETNARLGATTIIHIVRREPPKVKRRKSSRIVKKKKTMSSNDSTIQSTNGCCTIS